MPEMLACLTTLGRGGKTRFSCNTDSIVLVDMGSSGCGYRSAANGSTKRPRACKGSANARVCKGAAARAGAMIAAQAYMLRSLRRASPHCMVVNLVRSGRKQPQLFSASAGGQARHPFIVGDIDASARTSLAARARSVRDDASRRGLRWLDRWPDCWRARARRRCAVDGIVGRSSGSGDGTDMGRVAIQWDWKKRWLQGQDWHLGGYWDLGLGYWKRDDVAARARTTTSPRSG